MSNARVSKCPSQAKTARMCSRSKCMPLTIHRDWGIILPLMWICYTWSSIHSIRFLYSLVQYNAKRPPYQSQVISETFHENYNFLTNLKLSRTKFTHFSQRYCPDELRMRSTCAVIYYLCLVYFETRVLLPYLYKSKQASKRLFLHLNWHTHYGICPLIHWHQCTSMASQIEEEIEFWGG